MTTSQPSIKLPDGRVFIATSAGLPNSCSITGEPILDEYWYAENEDAARAGQGIEMQFFLESLLHEADTSIDESHEEPMSLSLIDGIGDGTVEKLNSADIYTLRELAGASPEMLAAMLKTNTTRVQNWIEQASTLLSDEEE